MGQHEDFVYDDTASGHGQLKYSVDFEGKVTAYVYDTLGRVKYKRFYASLTAYNNGTGTPAQAIGYTYDAEGRQGMVTQDDDGNFATTGDEIVTTNSYDSNSDQLLTVTTQNTNTTFGWDTHTVNYIYDSCDRPAPVDLYQSALTGGIPDTGTGYTYDTLGRL